MEGNVFGWRKLLAVKGKENRKVLSKGTVPSEGTARPRSADVGFVAAPRFVVAPLGLVGVHVPGAAGPAGPVVLGGP